IAASSASRSAVTAPCPTISPCPASTRSSLNSKTPSNSTPPKSAASSSIPNPPPTIAANQIHLDPARGSTKTMRPSLQFLIQKQNMPRRIAPNRRNFLFGAAAALAASRTGLFAAAFAPLPDHAAGPLKIEAVEILELHGRYTEEAEVNKQPQVNPLDIYDDLRPAPYTDKPSSSKEVLTTAIYLRIRTAGGIDGLYGPIEKDAAVVVNDELRPF